MANSTRLEWNGRGVKVSIRKAVIRFLNVAVRLVQAEAKRLLSVAGSGRVRGRKSGPVQRSAPGEPPRKQTGVGRASVAVEVDENRMEGRVGPTTKYMAYLELGTTRIAPRPWLRPAFNAMIPQIQAIVKQLQPSRER